MPAPSHTPNGYKRPLDAVSSDIHGFTADLCAGRGASAIKQVQLAGSQRLGCCWSPDGMCSACTCVPSHDPRQVRLHQHHQELVRSTAHGQPQKMLRAKVFFFFNSLGSKHNDFIYSRTLSYIRDLGMLQIVYRHRGPM